MLPSRLISMLTLRPGGIPLQHAAQLLGAFDVLPVELQHDVVDLESDLSGGGVVVDEGDDGAAHFFELERLRLVLCRRR